MANIQIGIVMGSDSDLPCMKEAAAMLDSFDIGYEMTIVSAHRTPKRLEEFAVHAEESGMGVIIAGAGGAAHLPGMMAAYTALPVIGVPIQTKTLSGVDSLYSIVQMPPGVPVATVAIGGGKNAGILAAQILGASDITIRDKVVAYKKSLEEMVLDKAQTLELEGYDAYLTHM